MNPFEFTKVEEFDDLFLLISKKQPKEPKHPKSYILKSNFKKESDYHKMMSSAYSKYELEMSEYERLNKIHRQEMSDLYKAFKIFAINDLFSERISKRTKDLIYYRAQESSYLDGFKATYKTLVLMSFAAHVAFKEALEDVG